MPPGNGSDDNSIRRPYLRVVEPSSEPPAAEERLPSSPSSPSSSPPPGDRLSLPPRYADSSNLKNLVKGEDVVRTPFQSTLMALGELANPRPLGGYEVSFRFRNAVYHLFQESYGSPIRLSVTQEREGQTTGLLRLEYLPDGKIQSSINPEPHETLQGPESSHSNILQRSILAERARRILIGQDLYVRLRTALEALKGRYTPETQSVWFDNFAVYRGNSYTYRIRNLLGLPGIEPNPQTSQISIYEERGAERVKLLTLSATGENNWDLSRPDREPLSPTQLEHLKKLVEPMERALVNPEAYQQELHTSLVKLNGSQAGNLPEINRSIDIYQAFGPGRGPRGEPLLDLRSTWDLFRNFHPWATHRWENPANPQEVRYLGPRWRLSLRMTREIFRRTCETLRHSIFENPASPKPNSHLLRLHLFPEGGGQVTLYRKGNIHDILIAEARGPVWRASREIQRMEKKGTLFESRASALQAAVASRGTGKTLPDPIRVQEAPVIDLDRIHLDPDGSTVEIRDAQTAWQRVQLQIPEAVNPRVQSSSGGTLLSKLLPVPAKDIDQIRVDFRESQPFQRLEIQHQDIRTAEGRPIRRVELILHSGENSTARVFEEGTKRPDIERDIHRGLLTDALEGNLPVSRWRLAAQALPRIYGYYKTSGATYGLSYFFALPFTLGFERLFLTEGERRLIGTPMPDLSLRFFIRDFSIPFMTLSTVSGVTGVATDGFFNMRPGLAATLRHWQAGATFTEAYRLSKPSFFNEYPHIRPIGRNFFFRGLLQRSLPLFTGLIAMGYLHPGPMNWRRFGETALMVGGVSTVSALVLGGVYSSEALSVGFWKRGWIQNTLMEAWLAQQKPGTVSAVAREGMFRHFHRLTAAGRGSRHALTFRGGVWFATAELFALGALAAWRKKAWVAEVEAGFRSEAGSALDRRNELITRLEHGEDVPPRQLTAADQEVQIAIGAYRRFLDLDERQQGSGNFSALGLDNDFEDAYASLERNSLLQEQLPVKGMARMRSSSLYLHQASRLGELRERYDRMEAELQALYARHGVAAERPQGGEENLGNFLRRLQEASNGAEAGRSPASAEKPPVSVDSPEGSAILEQFRWKAARDPSFVFWSPERRAQYLLRQFRGYRVTESDGSARPWHLGEALAFLSAAEVANAQRAQNLEESLTLPQSREGHDTARLDAILRETREIRGREAASHTHAREHARSLANNVADLDRQMEAYYQTSNARMAGALERWAEPQLVAMANP